MGILVLARVAGKSIQGCEQGPAGATTVGEGSLWVKGQIVVPRAPKMNLKRVLAQVKI
jgi:hypothetical protein